MVKRTLTFSNCLCSWCNSMGDLLMRYYIENNEGLWWSRIDGWCDNTRSLYTQEERDTLNLPMGEGVQWVEVIEH